MTINDDTMSLGVPIAPFEVIDLKAAMLEDAPGWRRSILEEYKSLKKMNIFIIKRGKLPPGRKIIPSRLVLKKKFNTNGKTIRLKSRLYIRGDKQEAGIDYFKTFASVMRFDTLRYLLAKAAIEDLEIDHMDVDQAFINPTLNEIIFMSIPPYLEELYPELVEAQDAYLQLNKSLYSLCQVPRKWFLMVKEFFQSLGLNSSEADPNLFIKRKIYVLVFMDNIPTIGLRRYIGQIKKEIGSRWECKDLGPADLFVGFQIQRNRQE